MKSQFNNIEKIKVKQKLPANIFCKDYSTILFLIYQLLLDAHLIINFPQYYAFTITVCIFNAIIAMKLIISPKKEEYPERIYLFISKLSSIVMIPIINEELKMILIAVFQTLDFNSQDKTNFRYIETMIIKLGSLVIFIMNYDLIALVSLSFTILIELNKINQVFNVEKDQQKLEANDYQGGACLFSSQEQENLWKTRIQMIPVSFFMINSETLKFDFKNVIALQYFSLFCEDEKDVDDLILTKLHFSLLLDNIDQIQQSTSYLKVRQRLRSRQPGSLPKDQPKLESQRPTMGSPPINCTLKQIDTNELLPQTYTLVQIINSIKDGDFKEFIQNNCIELVCQQNWTSSQRFQLSGQLLLNQQDGEIILLLNDISKQNELQQLLSKDEFKSKVIVHYIQMIESFSHELRTPLNSAINFLSAALQDQLTSERTKTDLILPAINSLKVQSFLISDIIDFSQNYANNFELTITEFAMQTLINEISQLFQMQIKMKNLQFSVDLMDFKSNSVIADQCRLKQILVNLMQNSIKFSQDGLIVIKIASFTQEQLKITVCDMGQGISAERLQQIQYILDSIDQHKDFKFDKSWQGFGLLISAMLVTKLAPSDRNKIRIESGGTGCGTKVTFYITNHLKKQSSIRQNTIRLNTQKFQSSNNLASVQNINGTLIQTIETGQKVKFQKSSHRNSEKSYDNSLFSESMMIDSLDQKFSLLVPVHPSFITEITSQPNKFAYNKKNYKHEISSEESNVLSIAQLKLMEENEDEENLNTYKRKRKCGCQRIMSVDDEIFNQKSLQILLSTLGFEVILAFNGEQACTSIVELKKCGNKCQLLTLILMDYQMPIMDGCQATVKLVKMMNEGIIPKIHIVGLTAFTNSSDIENCISAGMSDVLHKPLNLKEFKEILALI